MEALSRLTGLEAPASLTGLQGKPYLHQDVIEKTDISDYVLEKLPTL